MARMEFFASSGYFLCRRGLLGQGQWQVRTQVALSVHLSNLHFFNTGCMRTTEPENYAEEAMALGARMSLR